MNWCRELEDVSLVPEVFLKQLLHVEKRPMEKKVWLVALVGILFWPTLGRSEEHNQQPSHGGCHLKMTAELGVNFTPTPKIGAGPELKCVTQSHRFAWHLSADVVVAFMPKIVGGLSTFSSIEWRLQRGSKWWLGLGTTVTKLLDTPQIEWGVGPVIRVTSHGMPPIGFILLGEVEFFSPHHDRLPFGAEVALQLSF
jgi:hypothetical protein